MLIGVRAQLAPLALERELQLDVLLDTVHELGVVSQIRREGPVLLGPLLPLDGAKEVLDRHEAGVAREPVLVRLAEIAVGAGLLAAGKQLERGLLVVLEQRGVAREGAETRVGRAEAVGRGHRENLPVAHARRGEPVHELLCRSAQGAGLAAVGDGGHMAQHAHAALERLLEAGLLVEVQDGGAERPQEDLCLAVVDLGGVAAHHVAHGLVDHGHAHGARVVEAGVDEHADLAAVLAAAPEAEHVVPAAKGLELAVGEHRQRLSDGDGVAEDIEAVTTPAAPREGRAVVRVAQALEAQLVAVVHARHARQRHLQQHGEPQAAHGKRRLALVEAERLALGLGHRVGVGCVAEHRVETLTVVAAQQVERAVERVARVVLAQLLQAGGQLVGTDMAADVVKKPCAQRIVHHAVELLALEVLAELAVGKLVRRVLPHLADEHGVVLLGHRGGLDLGDELVGELVGHVHAPAARAGAQPFAHDAVLAAHELVERLAVVAVARHVLVAPPAGVGSVLIEGKPVGIRRLDAVLVGLPCTGAGVVLVAVEVHRVAAAVVPHAVENHRDAHLGGLVAQAPEVLLGTQHRIDVQVVGRIVAVITLRLEDRVEVDDGHAQALEVAELLADALEGAAVEVPARDSQVGFGLALVCGGGVPVLHEHTLGAVAVCRERSLGLLAPTPPAREAVGKHLVDDAPLVPVGLRRARLEHGDLERRRVPVGEGTLAGGPAGLGAVAPHSAVGGLDVEAVPHNARLGRLIVHREVQVVARRRPLHLDKLLAVGIGPHPQRAERDVVVPDIDAQRDDAAQLGGAEWSPVLLL